MKHLHLDVEKLAFGVCFRRWVQSHWVASQTTTQFHSALLVALIPVHLMECVTTDSAIVPMVTLVTIVQQLHSVPTIAEDLHEEPVKEGTAFAVKNLQGLTVANTLVSQKAVSATAVTGNHMCWVSELQLGYC